MKTAIIMVFGFSLGYAAVAFAGNDQTTPIPATQSSY